MHYFQIKKLSSTHSINGFSLLEVMIIVSILAILTALAAPSFQLMIEKWRVQETVESMKSTIYYARSESIKRGGNIGIEKNPKTLPGCTLAEGTNEWGCGWFVFVDSDRNGKWKNGEEILKNILISANINVIHKNGGANITVDRYGMMSGLNAKGFIFSPAPAGISSPATRALCMAAGGRIRVIEDFQCSN